MRTVYPATTASTAQKPRLAFSPCMLHTREPGQATTPSWSSRRGWAKCASRVRARVDAEGRIRRADEEIGRLEQQSHERLEAMQADIAAVADERQALVEEVRRISARLAEIVAEAEPEPPAAAVAPETNGTDAGA